jgi:hypothetical protein
VLLRPSRKEDVTHTIPAVGVADPDLHYFGKLDPDPYKSEIWIRVCMKVYIQEH